jgi:nucleotide-binding universal stress UspA family protein
MAVRTVLVCSDGSEPSLEALKAGLDLLGPDVTPVLVTAVPPIDWGALHGTGHAGPLIDDAGYDAAMKELEVEGKQTLAVTAERLGLPEAERCFVWGEPGPEICRLAEERRAAAIVIGTRGRGGLRRALLGSVSDHVVRHASVPVVVTRPADEG